MKIRRIAEFQAQGDRASQQDKILVLKERGIFALADGFGGGNSGAAASEVVCEAIRQFLVKEAGDKEATLPFVLRSYYTLGGNILFNSLVYANRKLVEMNKPLKLEQKGGASAIAAYLDGNSMSLASVGTTLAYIIRDGELVRLNVPRSLGQVLNPTGFRQKWEDQIPLAALGIWNDFEPEIFEVNLLAGDMLCFVSSGVGDVWIDQVLDVVRLKGKGNDEEEVEKALSDIFKHQRFASNASFLLVEFG